MTIKLRDMGFRYSLIQSADDVVRIWFHPMSWLCFFCLNSSLTSTPCGGHMAAASPHLLPGIVLSVVPLKGLRFPLTLWAYNGRIRGICRMYPILSPSLCSGECEDLIGSGCVMCSVQTKELRLGEAKILKKNL